MSLSLFSTIKKINLSKSPLLSADVLFQPVCVFIIDYSGGRGKKGGREQLANFNRRNVKQVIMTDKRITTLTRHCNTTTHVGSGGL